MKPLAGQRIVVTRPPRQARALCTRLDDAGATCIALPTIDVVPVAPDVALDTTLRALASFDWIVFTSANGVEAAATHLERLGIAMAALGARPIAAIGPATRSALRELGLEPAAMPEEFLTERIADVLGEVRGCRVLLLRADMAGDVLPGRLRGRGARVDDVPVYRTVERPYDPDAATLFAGGVDAIAFTSPSTVRGFCRVLGDAWRRCAAGAAIVTIGPVTSAAVRAAGLEVTAEASRQDAAGLIAALVACCATQSADGATP